MTIILNGDPVDVGGPMTLTALLAQLGVDARRVAVEHNLNVIKRPNYDTTQIQEGDQVEIVNFVGGGIKSEIMTEPLVIAGREFKSRLIVGTGKYSSFAVMQRWVVCAGMVPGMPAMSILTVTSHRPSFMFGAAPCAEETTRRSRAVTSASVVFCEKFMRTPCFA